MYLRVSRGMFPTIWGEYLKQCRPWDLVFGETYQDIAPGADGQTVDMLARARLEKARCGVLAYRTGSCAASQKFTNNVLLEPERVRYVRRFGNDCLRQLRLCVAPVQFLCGSDPHIGLSSRTFLALFEDDTTSDAPRNHNDNVGNENELPEHHVNASLRAYRGRRPCLRLNTARANWKCRWCDP